MLGLKFNLNYRENMLNPLENSATDAASKQFEPTPAESSETAILEISPADIQLEQDEISVIKWFAAFFVLLLGASAALWIHLRKNPIATTSWVDFKESVKFASPGIKLLIFGLYQSVACTFIPLNTSWIVSAMSMQSVALTNDIWSTVFLVALVGGAASTLANLNDYHIFTLAMRNPKIAKIRNTKLFIWATTHFDRAPFLMVLLFNLAPLPIDVARILAAVHRYSRVPFAIANFLGRFIRYFLIAFITYIAADKGWLVPIALIAIAIFIPAVKYLISRVKNSSPITKNQA